jgi:cysteinyl-tRNA synthetase
MAAKYLGQPFEIHGGGTDLIFPHHENEIAQSEAAAGCAFADLWIHNGMLQSGSEKMSKSLGNIVALSDIAKRVPPEALRLFYLRTHYRAPLDYSTTGLEETQKGLDRLYESIDHPESALDPIQIFRRYEDVREREIVALIAAGLAF